MPQSINKEVFGKRLKQLMKTYSETTYSLGKQFKLSPPSISRYTRGEMAPKMTTIYALSEYFDVNPEWLMGKTVSMYTSEIIDETDAANDDTFDISVFDEIRYDCPIFSNHKTDKHLAVPIKSLTEWGPVFGYRIPDDSMAPILSKDDLVVIKLSTNIQNGNLVALHVRSHSMIIRKIRTNGPRIVIQPVNPEFDADALDRRKSSVQIIGSVVYCLHTEEKYFSLPESE